MPDKGESKIYVQMKFPDGVEEIVKAVYEEMKGDKPVGSLTDNFENGANLVIKRIEEKWQKTPEKTVVALRWAKTECFRLQLIDLDRLGCIRNHAMCQPEKKTL
jgi:hypothetical protein